jgi:ferredoxin
MPKIIYLPAGLEIDAPENAKILAMAVKNKIDIRYGCGACRCGTCGILIEVDGEVSGIQPNERELLERMHLPLDGTVRLACQTRVKSGTVRVDLDFQNRYSPESGIDP